LWAVLLADTLLEDISLAASGVALISPAHEYMLLRPDSFYPLSLALKLHSLAVVSTSPRGSSARSCGADRTIYPRPGSKDGEPNVSGQPMTSVLKFHGMSASILEADQT
jgi:hypothetical protein